MDRAIVYPAALPQDTDILNTNKFHMLGLAYAMHGILGTNTVVEGLACTPTSPTADLNVHVAVGSIYSVEPTDGTAYGSLGTDSASIVKQGISNSIVTLAITPPGTSGFSQVYLVEAIYNDVDAGSQVLSYFNAANPAAPYSGPANSGSSQFTTRTGVCTIALKAGVAATTGTQTTPSPDAGYTGLFAITVANGATQVTSGNIVQLSTAPFFPTLPAVPADVQNELWTYAVDTSAGGANVVTSSSTATSSAVLNFSGGVPSYVATGMKVFDLTTVGAITGGQTVLSKTGTSVTLTANVNATVNSGDTIAFSNNAIVASISPAPAALVPGLTCAIKMAGTNTGAATLNLNGLGAVNIHRATGANLVAGDLMTSMVADFVYDGAAFQVCNFNGGGSGTGATTVVSIPYAADTGTVNNIVASFSPAITSLAAGTTIEVKIANTNSSATKITVNSLSAVNVTDRYGNALLQGALNAGEVALMIYDGTEFQVVNNVIPTINTATTFYVNNSTGNDANNGLTTGTAWATLTHAVAAIATYTLNGFSVTLQLANTGIAYPAPPAFNAPSSGPFIIQGNAGSQGSYVVSGAGTANGGVIQIGGGNVTLIGLTLQNTGTQAHALLGFDCAIALQNVTMTSTAISNFGLATADFGCTITSLGGNIWAGSAAASMWANGGQFVIGANQVTSGTPTFTNGFAYAANLGVISLSVPGWTFSGSGSLGPRYSASTNAVIQTNGAGANYFPGTTPGSTATGGQYA